MQRPVILLGAASFHLHSNQRKLHCQPLRHNVPKKTSEDDISSPSAHCEHTRNCWRRRPGVSTDGLYRSSLGHCNNLRLAERVRSSSRVKSGTLAILEHWRAKTAADWEELG